MRKKYALIAGGIGAAIVSILGVVTRLSAGEPLEVGATAPSPPGFDQDGKPVDLSAFYARGLTLVYFYPKADTPGCTAEACSLRDAFAQLTEKGIQVVGVSRDTVEAQKKFKEKYNLPFTLVADKEGGLVQAFGVPSRLGMASRQSFLIKDGKVIWRDLSASTSKQAEDVLKVVEALKSS